MAKPFDTMFSGMQELWRYLTGSPLSRIRQMRALSELDDHLLRDIGITSREVRLGRLQDAGRARPVAPAADTQQGATARGREKPVAQTGTCKRGGVCAGVAQA